uniref:MAM domain-containing protein n=1 Tax=Plectus sambesii TaxID=2011161 RepID=A0A914W839_9BILA
MSLIGQRTSTGRVQVKTASWSNSELRSRNEVGGASVDPTDVYRDMVLRRITLPLLFFGIFQEALGCISSAPQVRPNVAAADFGPTQPLPPPTLPAGLAARAQGPGPAPTSEIGGTQNNVVDRLVGSETRASDYDPTGYNSEGGGPVNSGTGLTCDFDRRKCCWANVAVPEDQLDWQMGSGRVDGAKIQRHFGPFRGGNKTAQLPTGNFLIASARSAGPSDEAQFASCSIACSSGPITVKARHWQSENVLLQVCERESFPTSADFNPLLNCQEFPHSTSPGPTTVVLPKASLVDIVFVASNFVSEDGDVAIIDDIEVTYSNDGEECADSLSSSTVGAVETAEPVEPEEPTSTPAVAAAAPISAEPVRQPQPPSGSVGTDDCHKTKCDFENGNTCNYKDAHQSESIRGVTSGFQVVKGQFMNRVTGVREGAGQGDYYIATFLFPREMAGIEADVGELPVSRTVRFQFYEGTHGVQLKGCCGSIESCPFSSDKDVSVTDRSWKTASFSCPQGTRKILFVCENTRTNQGACGLDDITVLKSDGGLTDLSAEVAC